MAKTDKHNTHRELELMEALRELGGSSRTGHLAEMLGVSEETVRRTVKALSKTGHLERVHGGVYLPNTDALIPVHSRLEKRSSEKALIAAAAAKLVPNGSSVFLDVGSTTAYVADALTHHANLTILTNALHPAQTLATSASKVYLAGGDLRSVEGGTFGPETISYVNRFNIDVAIISVDGFDDRAGFLLAGAAEADLARTVTDRAKRVIIVADHSKFGQSAPILACDPSVVEVVVTDKKPSANFRDALERWDIELQIVGKK